MRSSIGRAKASAHTLSRSFTNARAHNSVLAIGFGVEDGKRLAHQSFVEGTSRDGTFTTAKSAVPSFMQSFLSCESQHLQPAQPTTSSDHTQLSAQVKKKIQMFIEKNMFIDLAEALAAWTLPSLALPWNEVLTREELSHLVGELVNQQARILTQSNASKFMEDNSYLAVSQYRDAHRFKRLIREIFANLLGKDGHLYAQKLEYSVDLTPKEFENIINLELQNGKLDLASLWFQYLEKQHPNGQHYTQMTRELWLLKFKVSAGGYSPLWIIDTGGLYDHDFNTRQSFLASETQWLRIFDEYSRYQKLLLGCDKVVLDKELVKCMINSVAYNKNIRQVYHIIEQNWGILPTGELVAGFQKPTHNDLLYPDNGLLATIVVALIFNSDFRSALAFINGFQTNYDIDLQENKVFWDDIFRWSDSKTRYREYRALQIYLKETKCNAVVAPTSNATLQSTLRQAQASPSFDYQGYLEYINGLRSMRVSLFQELWKCYKECKPGYSTRPFETYLKIIKEAPEDSLCYDLLTDLSREWLASYVNEESFNKSWSYKNTDRIEHQYISTLKTLLDYKGDSGEFAELKHIINKWSLTEDMKLIMERWLGSREPHYYKIAAARAEKDEQNRLIEEQEEFLNIF